MNAALSACEVCGQRDFAVSLLQTSELHLGHSVTLSERNLELEKITSHKECSFPPPLVFRCYVEGGFKCDDALVATGVHCFLVCGIKVDAGHEHHLSSPSVLLRSFRAEHFISMLDICASQVYNHI